MVQPESSLAVPVIPGRARATRRRAMALRLFPPTHPTAEIERVVVILAVAGVVALAVLPLDALSEAAGDCMFHRITGIPCATCGASRAIVALGHAQFLHALRMNPLLVVGILFGVAYAPFAALAWWLGWRRPRLCLDTTGAKWGAALAVLVLVLANWAFLIADGR